MHRMHRIFSGDGWLVFPDILKSVHAHCPSQRLLQQPPVLIILCILCIDVPFIVLLDGSAQSRGGGRRARRQTGVSQRGQAGFSEKSPAGYPPPHHRDDTPGSAGVPPACCPFGCRSVSLRCCSQPPCRRGNRMGPGRSRGRAPLPVDSGEGDRLKLREDLCGRDARAPGWASSHDRVTPTGQKVQKHFSASCR